MAKSAVPGASKQNENSEERNLNGEWELEHDFMCSSCGEIFDELREVWHHKWDAHPGCLVMHITLPRKSKTYLPPNNLIHPQLGRQLIIGAGAANGLQFKGKGKKKRIGGNKRNLSDVAKPEIPPLIEPQNFYICKKCYKNEAVSLGVDGELVGRFNTKEEFYIHLLECGGDYDWKEENKKKNKKKKGSKGNRNQTAQPKGRKYLISFVHIIITSQKSSYLFTKELI